MGSPDFALSCYEFDILWAELGLGRVPRPLEASGAGSTPGERAMLVEEVCRELISRGLLFGRHRIDDGLAALLRLLGDHRLSVELVGNIGYPVRALAATSRQTGVLAVLAGGELWLTGIRPTELAAAIVGLLPAVAPGSGPSMKLTYGAPAQADFGLRRGETATLRTLAATCRRAGKFGISVDGRGGMLPPVTWFDTDGGRYLMVAEDEGLYVSPADHAVIERSLATILTEVDGISLPTQSEQYRTYR